MKRWTAVVLLLLSVFTLAPRTSWPVGAGWRAVIHTDTFEAADAPVSTLVFTAVPPANPDPVTVFTMTITGGEWELLAASKGCTQVAGKVACVLHSDSLRRASKLRVTVRAIDGDALHWTMSAAAGG